jgi:hypothetical protein
MDFQNTKGFKVTVRGTLKRYNLNESDLIGALIILKMFFGKKKKKDVLALSLLLVNIAGGELGKTELDEIIAVLREEIACTGLTLYGYDFEGNLSVVASTYSTVCPEWMEAQKSAFQQVIDQEWLDGVCYDVNVPISMDI